MNNSLISCSCKPNVTYETCGSKLSVTAIAVIVQGQPLSFNYIEPYLPRAERHTQLQSRYHFECTCEMCTPDAPDIVRAFMCRKCEGGIIYPVGPGTDPAQWTCVKCGKGISSKRHKKFVDMENA